MADLVDRKYVSRYTRPTFSIDVYRGGAPGEADGPVSATLIRLGSTPEQDVEVFDRPAGHGTTRPGLYEVSLTSMDTSKVGDYELMFNYVVDGLPEVYGFDIQVGPQSPEYDRLSPLWADIVDAVWLKFADLYDSPYGGPNLQTYVQTNFGRNRLAQLLTDALDSLNTASGPHVFHEMNSEGFPMRQWGGLLRRALYIEVLRHLVRSYTEQPEVVLGTAVSRTDRRDYMQRWGEVLNAEERRFEQDLSKYKMANMGLGNVNVMVSGGAYGKIGPYANAGGSGQAAARGYFAVRRSH